MSEFDEFAEEYEQILSEISTRSGFDIPYFHEYKIKEIYNFVKSKRWLDKPIDFLNFGCGIGQSEKFIRKYFRYSNIYSVDISEKSIEIAKQRNKEIGNIHFKTFDGYGIPFENRFDIIFVANVFHHIPPEKHMAILENFCQKLKDRGYLFIFEHNPFNPMTVRIVKSCKLDQDANLLNPIYTNKILAKSGFKWRRIGFKIFFPKSLWFLIPLEKYLTKLPLGGQYYFVAKRNI